MSQVKAHFNKFLHTLVILKSLRIIMSTIYIADYLYDLLYYTIFRHLFQVVLATHRKKSETSVPDFFIII